MLNTPFPPWPSFAEDEISAVARVLRSNQVNYWTGTEAREFETEFARWVGVPHAVALNNGTVALEAALKALGTGPGDEVIVSPRSFIASAALALFRSDRESLWRMGECGRRYYEEHLSLQVEAARFGEISDGLSCGTEPAG